MTEENRNGEAAERPGFVYWPDRTSVAFAARAADVVTQLAQALVVYEPDHPAIPRARKLVGYQRRIQHVKEPE